MNKPTAKQIRSAILDRATAAPMTLDEIARRPMFRGVHFGALVRAADALVASGMIEELDGAVYVSR